MPANCHCLVPDKSKGVRRVVQPKAHCYCNMGGGKFACSHAATAPTHVPRQCTDHSDLSLTSSTTSSCFVTTLGRGGRWVFECSFVLLQYLTTDGSDLSTVDPGCLGSFLTRDVSKYLYSGRHRIASRSSPSQITRPFVVMLRTHMSSS